MSKSRRPHRPAAASGSPRNPYGGGGYWLYGHHACEAAAVNPSRHIRRALVAVGEEEGWRRAHPYLAIERTDNAALGKLLGDGAVHQGVALLVDPLDEADWNATLASTPTVLVLDQVTDPHNVGAILRTAAAFGVGCVMMPKDHAPAESGVMAKAACGALDLVPLMRVTNLAKTLETLKQEGYWILGLDGEATKPVAAAADYRPLCLVLGAEGAGMRRLTREHCDVLISIPMDRRMESLNVSNAAAIALFCAFSAR